MLSSFVNHLLPPEKKGKMFIFRNQLIVGGGGGESIGTRKYGHPPKSQPKMTKKL